MRVSQNQQLGKNSVRPWSSQEKYKRFKPEIHTSRRHEPKMEGLPAQRWTPQLYRLIRVAIKLVSDPQKQQHSKT